MLQSYMDCCDSDSVWKLKFMMNRIEGTLHWYENKMKKWYASWITRLYEKELASRKVSTSMMFSPTSLAIAGRGTMDASSSHGKCIPQQDLSFNITSPTQKLKMQRCYGLQGMATGQMNNASAKTRLNREVKYN